MIFRRAFSYCLMFLLLLSPAAFSQEANTQESETQESETQETETQEAQEPQKTEFEKSVDAWTEVKAKMQDLKSKFPLEQNTTEQTKLRQEYLGLLDEAKLIIDDLRDMSLSAFEADPSDAKALQIMMGVAVQDANDGKDKTVLELGDKLIAAGIDPAYFETAAAMDRLSIEGKEVFEELIIRQKEAKADNNPRVVLKTNKGDIVLELFEDQAPDTVGNFVSLVKQKFYDGLTFHRVINDFMAQTGDPKADGTGGPGYNIFCECDSPEYRRHFTGSLSMAKQTAPDTGGSQFFMAMTRTKMLDGKHTVFGRVVSGMDVIDELTRTHTTNPITGLDDPIPGAVADKITTAEVVRDRGHDYAPNKVPEETEEKGDAEAGNDDNNSDPGDSEDGENSETGNADGDSSGQ